MPRKKKTQEITDKVVLAFYNLTKHSYFPQLEVKEITSSTVHPLGPFYHVSYTTKATGLINVTSFEGQNFFAKRDLLLYMHGLQAGYLFTLNDSVDKKD